MEKRLNDSIDNALKLADGLMIIDVIDGEPMTFSQHFSCPDCGISIDEIQPRSFRLIIRLVRVLIVMD